MKTDFVDPSKFKKDLLACYISGFFAEELRNIYTARERQSYINKTNPHKVIKACEDHLSVLCYKQLNSFNVKEQMQTFNVYRTANILGNLKFYHFYKNDFRQKRMLDKTQLLQLSPTVSIESRMTPERNKSSLSSPRSEDQTQARQGQTEEFLPDEILMERQSHQCKFMLCEDFVNLGLREKRSKMQNELRLIEEGVIDHTLISLQKYFQRNSRSELPSTHGSPKGVTVDRFDSDDDIDDISIEDLLREEDVITPSRKPTADLDHFKERISREQARTDLSSSRQLLDSEEQPQDKDSQEGSVDGINDMEGQGNELLERSVMGLFGLIGEDSEDEEEEPKGVQFSFVDHNINKYNFLEFIQTQEKPSLNIN